jgi:hypothetical protein
MASKIATKIKHTQFVRDIKVILGRGSESAQMDGEGQIVKTHWAVGKYLTENFAPEDVSGGKNTGIIKHLARTFEQPSTYFHTVMEFYQCYPDLPTENVTLSWAQYKALLTVEDGKR